MNLKAWTERPVFKPAKTSDAGEVPECRGNLTVSMAAGEGGRGDPRIGEAGRAFLQERMQLLTDAHVRALMSTARVEKLSDSQVWKDPKTGTSYNGLDAWVAAAKDKVRQSPNGAAHRNGDSAFTVLPAEPGDTQSSSSVALAGCALH